jgi:hypothetical protein
VPGNLSKCTKGGEKVKNNKGMCLSRFFRGFRFGMTLISFVLLFLFLFFFWGGGRISYQPFFGYRWTFLTADCFFGLSSGKTRNWIFNLKIDVLY